MDDAGGGGAQQAAERDGGEESNGCWHEVHALAFPDPVSGHQLILLVQSDVTHQQAAQRQLVTLLEAEHQLLENVFPRHVLEHVAFNSNAQAGRMGLGSALPQLRDARQLATRHEMVTILFADICGFTNMCKKLDAEIVMDFLNGLFSKFDDLLDIFGVYKVETIGDCYMVAGGLMKKVHGGALSVRSQDEDHDPMQATRVVEFAKAMLRAASQVTLPTDKSPVRLRVGIHSGPVTSGIVGQRMPRFCLFGDTINTASRMESTCQVGCIHASQATRDLTHAEPWQPTGGIDVKGKGLMSTYLLSPSLAAGDSAALAKQQGVGAVSNYKQQMYGSNNQASDSAPLASLVFGTSTWSVGEHAHHDSVATTSALEQLLASRTTTSSAGGGNWGAAGSLYNTGGGSSHSKRRSANKLAAGSNSGGRTPSLAAAGAAALATPGGSASSQGAHRTPASNSMLSSGDAQGGFGRESAISSQTGSQLLPHLNLQQQQQGQGHGSDASLKMPWLTDWQSALGSSAGQHTSWRGTGGQVPRGSGSQSMERSLSGGGSSPFQPKYMDAMLKPVRPASPEHASGATTEAVSGPKSGGGSGPRSPSQQLQAPVLPAVSELRPESPTGANSGRRLSLGLLPSEAAPALHMMKQALESGSAKKD